MELFTPGHLIPLLIIAGLLFFGWKQLPDMAKSAGRSLRVFRTEIKGLGDDEAAQATKSALGAATDPVTPTPAIAPVTPEPVPPVAALPSEPAAPAAGVTAPETSGKPAG